MLYFERKLKKQGFRYIVGIDEAGRGPLAGPVVAAAVCLRQTDFLNRVDDSKKLSARQRELAYQEIIDTACYGVGIVDEKVIDKINILQATRLGMVQALARLSDSLNGSAKDSLAVIIDGNIRLDIPFFQTSIVRGDGRSLSIACASIIAKVTRDKLMRQYDSLYPEYGFARHKGYPTSAHRQALKRLGPCAIHRLSFAND